ncbi:MAG: DUF4286 family protein [Chitinophagales bacterium]|jgi:fructoselysine-6-P-deglycase FrlB-like protein|nr:DUF4286 family protein [Chitinophagales bacterium]HNL06046.1 DUF4286 family protein [Chitinophagales bacterium]
MILYNVTVKVELPIAGTWLQWMREDHIPAVMATGMFLSSRMSHLLLQDESDGITYSIQYECSDLATLQKYQAQYAPQLQKEHADKFAPYFVAFRTVLEVLN